MKKEKVRVIGQTFQQGKEERKVKETLTYKQVYR